MLACASSGLRGRAEDSVTNIISTTISTNLYVVGNTGKLNYLEIRNGGVLTATNSIIGWADTASTNSATVTGAGSRWLIPDTLYVGSSGRVSRLSILSAGAVTSDTAYVGYHTTSQRNSVLVSGANSRWHTAGSLVIGQSGAGNELIISNSAVASCGVESYIAGGEESGSNNTVTVTGAGSAWNHDGGLYVGYVGGGNSLTIAAAAVVSNDFAVIGSFNSTNNVVTVTGSNSTWRIPGGNLLIGDSQSVRCRLIVTNGGLVTSLSGTVGNFDVSGQHQVVVTGTGSRWLLADPPEGYSLVLGDQGSGNQLIIQATGLVANADAVIGAGVSSGNNTAIVTQTGSFWKNRDLTVGREGSGNRLIIQNGAVVSNRSVQIGERITASTNTVWVTGTGSRLVASGDCIVGNSGNAGLLAITAGAQALHSNTWIGSAVDSLNNSVLVTDPGSLLSNVAAMEVGYDGTGNQLVISNGARVVSSYGRVGLYGFLTRSTVSGSNSFWLNSGDLYVGQVGANTELTIANRGTVSNQNGYVGIYNVGTTVTVTDPGSRWVNRADLYVNYGGSTHRLLITNGAVVNNATGYIGYLDTSRDAEVLVTGAGSEWVNAGNLYVGLLGTSNRLTIANGGTVRATNLVVGVFDTSTNNAITVAAGNLIVTNAAGTAQITIQSGRLELQAGVVRTGTLLLSSNAVLTGHGTISAAVVTNAGIIAPGNSVGRLTVGGALRLQPTASLRFDLGGYSPGTGHDVLTVSNAATLAGTLAVSFVDGFQMTITNGASFTVLTASSIAGAFANATNGATIASTDGLATFQVSITTTNLILAQAVVIPPLNDGIPAWWRAQYFGGSGQTTNAQSCADCDPDGDGQSNLVEFQAGTDPTNSVSAFRIISVACESNNIRIVWMTGAGKTNALQVSTGNSFTNAFSDLFIVTNTVGSTINYLDIGAATNVPARFYRVRLVP